MSLGGGGLIIGAVLIIFAACTDKSKEVISPTPKEVAPLPTAVAKLQTHDEFFNLLDKIDKMKEEELNEWEKSKNFTSFRTVWKQAQVEWGSLRTDDDEAAFLKKYSDILEMKDNAVEPLIQSPFYQAICNRDGIFATSGGLTRIYREYCLNDSTGNYANLMNATEQSRAAAARIMWTGQGQVINLKDLAEVQADNWNGCADISRRVNFRVLVYNYVYYDFTDHYRYLFGSRVKFQHKVQFLAWGSKINWWRCRWIRYDTEIMFRNIKIGYDELYTDCNFPRDQPFTRYSEAKIDYSSSVEDVEYCFKEIDMSPQILVRKSYFDTHPLVNKPTSVHGSGEATTRGMGGRWVSITFKWQQ